MIYQYSLEYPLSEEMCGVLTEGGELKIFYSFPKPYFNIKAPGFLVKGIIGENRLEATYFDYKEKLHQIDFEKKLNSLRGINAKTN
jgi:hypothetical protein